MLQTIRIQNFRSLEDVTLTLQEVNLLIGPNNSGKSNLFKALEFLKIILQGGLYRITDLEKYFFLKKMNTFFLDDYPPLTFTIIDGNEVYIIEICGKDNDNDLIFNEFLGTLKEQSIENLSIVNLSDISVLKNTFSSYFFNANCYLKPSKYESESFNSYITEKYFSIEYDAINQYSKLKPIPLGKLLNKYSSHFPYHLSKTILELKTYAVDVHSLKNPFPTLAEEFQVAENGSNLVAVLDNLDDENKQIIKKIESDLKNCIGEFSNIAFRKVENANKNGDPKNHQNQTYKKIGFTDKYNQTYWADELSDGSLYFLALLTIIHQPNPPKLILLEEPENGIHPRRIKEIVDFIFDLAESKGIQVIMTTHSTVLIDEFKDLPESIFVFDKPGESTIIKNLQTDIIDVDSEQSKKLNLPQIDLSGSLGEHWASGLIGGVPI